MAVKTTGQYANDGSQFVTITDGAGNTTTAANPNGQATSANSTPVVIASDQSAVNVIPKGTGNLNTFQVTVGTTATVVAGSRTGRNAITVINLGTTDVFLGPSASVTTTNGLLLVGSKGGSVTLPLSGALYAIVGTGTQAISVAETY